MSPSRRFIVEFYVFKTRAEADACVKHINSDMGWYPIVGNVMGVPAPQNQQTLHWADEPKEMKDGSWAVPKVPDKRLDEMKVPVTVQDKTDLLAVHGTDIRTLTAADFPEPPDEDEVVVAEPEVIKP